MPERCSLFLIAVGSALTACSSTDVPRDTRPSVVLHSDPYDTTLPPVALPDTVRRGVPFTLTFITVYDSPICWESDGEPRMTIGRQTRITPLEVYVLPAGQAGPCDLLQVGVRSTSVTLNTLGVDTIRVVGRVDPYSTPDNRTPDSVSASVVVKP